MTYEDVTPYNTEIRIFDKTCMISEDEWSMLTKNPYESHAWFRVNEEYFRDTHFLFFCGFAGGRLRAVLPVYDKPSLVYPASARPLSRRARPLLKRITCLISGSPFSFVSDVIGDPSMDHVLLKSLEQYARKHRIDLISFPFSRRPVKLKGVFTKRSLTDYELDLPGNCLDHYFAMFRHKRRNAMKRELGKGGPVRQLLLEGNEELMSRFLLLSAARHGSKTSIPSGFYRLLARHMGSGARVLAAERNSDCVGILCYFVSADMLSLFHVGVKSRDFTYFKLVFYEPIRIAYGLGLGSINYRAGSDAAKVERGCRPIHTMLCYKPLSLKSQVLFSFSHWAQRMEALLQKPDSPRSDPD